MNDEALAVLLKEYEALRTESLQATQNQHRALSLGALAISFILGSAFTLSKLDKFLASVELTFFSTLIITFLQLNWAFEFYRMARVGDYVLELEKKINLKIGQNALNWEQWLRTEKKFGFSYFPYIYVFYISGMSCIAAGDYIWFSYVNEFLNLHQVPLWEALKRSFQSPQIEFQSRMILLFTILSVTGLSTAFYVFLSQLKKSIKKLNPCKTS